MTPLAIVRAFFDYNEWANGRVLEAAAALDPVVFAKDQGTSFGSIELNLAHIVAAQRIWLSRWKTGANPKTVIEEGDMHGYEVVRDAFAESHADLQGFIAALTDERVTADCKFKDRSGSTSERPLWQLMVHVVNHGTHHRAETAMALTALGHEPPPLDYARFEFERG